MKRKYYKYQDAIWGIGLHTISGTEKYPSILERYATPNSDFPISKIRFDLETLVYGPNGPYYGSHPESNRHTGGFITMYIEDNHALVRFIMELVTNGEELQGDLGQLYDA